MSFLQNYILLTAINLLFTFRLEHVAKEGDLLYPGSVIARLVDQKDGEKYKPKPFLESFPEWAEFSENERVLPETKRHTNCLNVGFALSLFFSVVVKTSGFRCV